MRWMRWTLIIVVSLSIHAGLAMAWIFNQPNLVRDPEPLTIAMVAFAAPEPASEPVEQVETPVEPEPEPVIEPEPEPVVEPVIALPKKKPEVKKKPKPKQEEKKKIKEDVKPVEKQLAMNNLKSDVIAPKTNNSPIKTANNTGASNSQSTKKGGPRALHKQAPAYSERARRLGKEGYVKVRYDINDDGRVTNIEFVEATPKGLFERDVKRAMNRWTFEKQPAKGYVTEIYFKLDGTVSQV
ncbi:TonB family protein [Providencia huaxiensis]|uniref:Protein TonB n=2 Tax=Providencia huaxiensis TaxID=2027290 RepID=A0A8I2D8I7_9GAMM|nr:MULTISPECIES: TonB family protein [Providencia]MBN6360595.1 TonB family protein [Providencia huaxiensis]MBQ0267354.1 TonB family protein [Providencia huaxiensis]MCD2527106.1 TonB family protein [Providencia huaxiensis]MCG9536209.1 TonB family protein [Providencia huaxiensis]QPE15663.1 TonB family protein [Providencia rettgeri]